MKDENRISFQIIDQDKINIEANMVRPRKTSNEINGSIGYDYSNTLSKDAFKLNETEKLSNLQNDENSLLDDTLKLTPNKFGILTGVKKNLSHKKIGNSKENIKLVGDNSKEISSKSIFYSMRHSTVPDKTLMNQIMKINSHEKQIYKKILIEKLRELKNHSFNSKFELIVESNFNTLLHCCAITQKEDFVIEAVLEVYEENSEKQEFIYWLTRENCKGYSALDICCEFGYQNKILIIFSYYQKYGIKLDFECDKSNIFHYLSKTDEVYIFVYFYEILLDKYQYSDKQIKSIINLKNELGLTPLQIACSSVNNKIFSVLLDLDTNLNSLDSQNNSALHYSVARTDYEKVKKLLDRGADKYIRNNNKHTVFDIALNSKNEVLIRLLKSRTCSENLFCINQSVLVKKSRRYDLVLFTFIFLYSFSKIYFSSRILMISLSRTGDDNSESNCSPICTTENVIELTSTIIDFLIIVFITVFILMKSKSDFHKKGDKNTVLADLFKNKKNACIKCKIVIDENSKHCQVCELCVKDYNHHCYWLNTCASYSKLGKFKFLVILIWVFIIMNLGYLIYTVNNLLKGQYNSLMKNMGLSNNMKYLFVVICFIFIFLMLLAIYPLISSCLLIFRSKKNKKVSNRSEKDEFLNQYDQTLSNF